MRLFLMALGSSSILGVIILKMRTVMFFILISSIIPLRHTEGALKVSAERRNDHLEIPYQILAPWRTCSVLHSSLQQSDRKEAKTPLLKLITSFKEVGFKGYVMWLRPNPTKKCPLNPFWSKLIIVWTKPHDNTDANAAVMTVTKHMWALQLSRLPQTSQQK